MCRCPICFLLISREQFNYNLYKFICFLMIFISRQVCNSSRTSLLHFYLIHPLTRIRARRHPIVIAAWRWVAFIGMGGCETIRGRRQPRARMHLRSHYSITINNRTANRSSALLPQLLGTLFRRPDQHLFNAAARGLLSSRSSPSSQ